MFIVSDELLERLICSQCKKYLSVKTIKVYPNRGIKCGRCSNAADAGVVSLYGVLAEQALFRCVNRFEGCNQLLSYSDVEEHEKSCLGKQFDCPCCIEPFKGTAYEIYIHFKEQHLDQLLVNTPEFVLEIDNELVQRYLYRKNELLFYVNARYSRGEEELILNVMYLGLDKDASKISQMFTLHCLDGKLKNKTKRKSCCSVTGGNLKSFKIIISPADFTKNVVVCRFDLNTENVENLVALPESYKKSKSDLEDKENPVLSSSIIKPSIFGKGTIFVRTTSSESKWGLQTPATTVSTSSFDPFSMGHFSSNGPTTTTAPSAGFGKSMGINSPNHPFTNGFQQPSSFSPTPIPIPSFRVSNSSNRPATTTGAFSAPPPSFGQSTSSKPWKPSPVPNPPTFGLASNQSEFSFGMNTTGLFVSAGISDAKNSNIFRTNQFTFGTPKTTGN